MLVGADGLRSRSSLTSMTGGPCMDTPRLPPSRGAFGVTILLFLAGVMFGAFVDLGDGPFVPRVETIDALAGLAAGAFLVDRLLTFIPPLGTGANRSPKQRTADLDFLRIGYGAVVGALFVSLTDLRAVAALTGEDTGHQRQRRSRDRRARHRRRRGRPGASRERHEPEARHR